MFFSPLTSAKPKPNTVLFVDNKTAEAIALTGGISSLVPSKYSLITSIEIPANEIQELTERLMLLNCQYYEIFISDKISKYSSQLKELINCDQLDMIQRIYTTDSTNTVSSILMPKYQTILVYSPSFLINLTDSISLSLTLRPNILEQISHFDSSTAESVYQTIDAFIPHNNICKCYSIGEFSNEIVSLYEKNKRQSSQQNSALLCIDRTVFPTPLFAETDSLLDSAAKLDFYKTINDKTFIEIELKKGSNVLKEKIQKMVKAKEPTIQSMSLAWSKLDSDTKEKLINEHPILLPLLNDIKTSNLVQFQDNLMNGENIEDYLYAVNSLNEMLSLIAFKSLITPSFHIHELVNEAYQNNPAESKNYCSKENSIEIIEHCGCISDGKSKIDKLSIFTLIKFIDSLLDPNTPDDPRIQGSGSGLISLFSKPQSIKSFQNIFIFVVGGMSFVEIREIQNLIQSKKSPINIKIATDTICSTINVFS